MGFTARIGDTITIQAFFRQADGTPLAVNTPTISVFYFDASQTKQEEVSAQIMTAGSETGRYVYTYTIPATFIHGQSLSVEMTGVDPGTGDTLVINDSLNLVSTSSLKSGLIVSFEG